MAVSRADTISQTLKKVETYSDFATSFTKHPLNGELVTVKNEDSIKQALKNTILTNIGERPFDPFFGSDVTNSMFELFTPFLIEDIRNAVNLSIKQFETRVDLLGISILDDSDKNGFSISIIFSIINNPEPIQLNIFLKRAR
jgi:phage baseplate assembly protein W